MPKFRAEYVYRYDPKTGVGSNREEDEIADVIRLSVESAQSERGELEDLDCKIEKLVNIVGHIANQLPPEAQGALANSLSWLVVEP